MLLKHLGYASGCQVYGEPVMKCIFRWLAGTSVGVSSSLLLGLTMAWLTAMAGKAQEFPPCPPPSASEYLLLVRGEDAAEREQVMSVLPADNPVMVCNYVNDVVVRAGGFTSLEAVNSWSVYLNDTEGFDAFVVSPANAAETPSAVSSGNSGSRANRAYQPQSLGRGYAVLVDYDNQPEIARSVQQQSGQPVGLAVYRGQPYLLAVHTVDAASAAPLLSKLTAAGLAAILVESEPVVRLAPAVNPAP